MGIFHHLLTSILYVCTIKAQTDGKRLANHGVECVFLAFGLRAIHWQYETRLQNLDSFDLLLEKKNGGGGAGTPS